VSVHGAANYDHIGQTSRRTTWSLSI
jgi:hypothetical protein